MPDDWCYRQGHQFLSRVIHHDMNARQPPQSETISMVSFFGVLLFSSKTSPWLITPSVIRCSNYFFFSFLLFRKLRFMMDGCPAKSTAEVKEQYPQRSFVFFLFLDSNGYWLGLPVDSILCVFFGIGRRRCPGCPMMETNIQARFLPCT